MYKSIVTTGAFIFIFHSLVSGVFAQNVSVTAKPTRVPKIREAVDVKMTKIPLNISSAVKKLKSKVTIGTGTVSAIQDTSLTVGKNDKTYSILTGTFEKCSTKFLRRYGGTSSFSEIQVGHELNIIGRWQDDTKTIVESCIIRDMSVQKRKGVFIGEVLTKSDSEFTMTTVSAARENQTVTISTDTKFTGRNSQTLTGGLSDIAVGHRVRVKGVWDRFDNTVTEVTEVKDYNLPPRPTRRPSPTRKPSPTRRPSPTRKPSPTQVPSLTPAAI